MTKLGDVYTPAGHRGLNIVDGTKLTGLYSKDGNYNAVINDGKSTTGLHHPCGAFNIVVVNDRCPGCYHVNGSYNAIKSATGYVLVDGRAIPMPSDPVTPASVMSVKNAYYNLSNGIYTINVEWDSSVRFMFDLSKLTNGATYQISFDLVSIQEGEVWSDFCDVQDTGPFQPGICTYTGTRATYDNTYRFIDFNCLDDEESYSSYKIRVPTLKRI